MASSKGLRRKPTRKTAGAAHDAKRKSARDMLLDKMRNTPQFDETIVLDEHPDLQKMSEVLLEYAEPLLEPLPKNDDKAFRNALTVGVMCWNAALTTKNEREEVFRLFLSQTPSDNTAELLAVLNFMVQRKLQLFKNNRRWIINYQIKSKKRDREVFVVSTVEPKQMKTLMPQCYRPWWKRLLFWTK